MDRNKLLEYFDAEEMVKNPIHIVGCGAVGSHVAETLARIGCTNIHLWDFDLVNTHNITNQMFNFNDVGNTKVSMVAEMMTAINPQIELTAHFDGLAEPWILEGHIFMCVDNIDVRRNIVIANQYNPNAITIIDFRMRLTDAQHYFVDVRKSDKVKNLINTMNFTNEEAESATPKSACNTELNVVYTVKTIVSFGVANWVNYLLDKDTKSMCIIDMEAMSVLCI